MKRRFSALLLVVALLSSLMTPVSLAAGETITFATNANVSGVKAGDTFEVTLDSNEITGAYSGDFKVEFDKTKLNATNISWNNEIPGTAPSTVTEANSNGFAAKGYVDNTNYEALTIPNNCHLGTITFKVLDDATNGSTLIKLTSHQFTNEYSATLSGITVNTEKLTINIVSTITGTLPISITAPAKNGTPQSTIAEGTGYTGSITWDPAVASGTFAANTVYTADVELTAKDGYQFASDVNPNVTDATISDKSVTDDGSKLTFKAAFPKTADKELTSLSISGNSTANVPTKGDTTTVKLTANALYDDGISSDVTDSAYPPNHPYLDKKFPGLRSVRKPRELFISAFCIHPAVFRTMEADHQETPDLYLPYA